MNAKQAAEEPGDAPTEDSGERLRKLLRDHCSEFDRAVSESQRIEEAHFQAVMKLPWPVPKPELPPLPGFPEECRGMTCGATTRAETPCKLRDIYSNGRCKFHGGASTGPRTKQGKRKSAMNRLRPKKQKRSS